MKKLNFTYEDKEYTLEFTRRTVAEMERRGFKATEITDKPMSSIPALFEGAFLAHHKNVKKETIEEIYDHLGDKEALIAKLAEMYVEPINSLMEEPKEGNVSWTVAE